MTAGAAPVATEPFFARPAENPAQAIQSARIEARARHSRALRDCLHAVLPAACIRDADRVLDDTLRILAGEQWQRAAPPLPAAEAAQRNERQRLMRELEQSAPTRLPPPGPARPHPPIPGRSLGR